MVFFCLLNLLPNLATVDPVVLFPTEFGPCNRGQQQAGLQIRRGHSLASGTADDLCNGGMFSHTMISGAG